MGEVKSITMGVIDPKSYRCIKCGKRGKVIISEPRHTEASRGTIVRECIFCRECGAKETLTG